MNPLPYIVRVNQDFYQTHSTIDPERFGYGSPAEIWSRTNRVHYSLPYRIRSQPASVLVLGAGGGLDVEAALLAGAKTVDAVDIDGAIIGISRTYSASDVYDDPRVNVHVEDARAFIERAGRKYDAVVFGLLDSQNLFSYGSSLRIDGYIYTVECFRRAYGLVNEGGLLAVSFAVAKPWVGQKLVQMLREATGTVPTVYRHDTEHIMLVPRFHPEALPDRIQMYERLDTTEWLQGVTPLATDTWPYLYLLRPGIPTDYALVIVTLLALSATSVLALRGRTGLGASDAHFFFMGWGFLLLQTKSIGDCSLYFGTTWVVSMIVICGTLLMVLLANFAAMGMRRASAWFYLPLLASILALALMPREIVLGWPYSGRLAWAVLAVPLPIFFAGLIFSMTFRHAPNPSASFGANLLGATMGGFCEYLGMWLGSAALSWIIIAAYILSMIALRSARRRTLIETGPGLSFARAD